MNKQDQIDCFFIDIDGVIFFGGEAIDGAKETLQYLKDNEYRTLFVTNATRHSNEERVKQFSDIGFEISENDILNTAYATADYIVQKKKNAKCFLTGADYLDKVYRKKGLLVTRAEEKVDFVVLGFDKRLDYATLDTALRLLLDGAELIAMHEDRFHPSEGKIVISLGGFVRALEYASGKKAVIIGKPNTNFFKIALDIVGRKESQAAMIGDSIASDIVGAQNAGIKGILVKTGGFREEDLAQSEIKPDLVIDSIKELPKAIENKTI